MDDFDREALRRLPLAEACLRLLDWGTRDELLADLFRRHRGASYEKVIGFPLFVHLIADALLQHDGSAHQSFTRARADGSLPASLKALYGKLARVPISLSRGLLTAATRQVQAVCPAVEAVTLPACLRGLAVYAVDGKKIKFVAKRLRALRGRRGHVLGGKLLVAHDVRTGLALALNAHPDGESGDTPLLPDLVAEVRSITAGRRLWLADRLFCDLVQPARLAAEGDAWLVRYNARVRFTADPARPARAGVDRLGRAWVEEWGWLGAAAGRRLEVRRLTLQRPGEEALVVVTDLLDGEAYPAADLLEVYRQRGGIERVFQRVTEVFRLRRLIGGTPRATIFQASFCLLLYNLIVTLRAYAAQACGAEAEGVSVENLYTDVRRQLTALVEVAGPEGATAVVVPRLTAGALRERLRELLAGCWTERWRKAPPKAAWRKHPDRGYLKGGHTSAYRLLQAARATQNKVDNHSG